MSQFWKDRPLAIMSVLLASAGIILIAYVLFRSSEMKKEFIPLGETSCVTDTARRTMNDPHMKGVLEKGRSFQVLMNYFKCNAVRRGELIYFQYSEHIEPIPRIVYGLPGDSFEVIQDQTDKSKYFVKINGEMVKTQAGKDHYFISNHTPPLKTYEISRKGIMDKDEYIIFASDSPGFTDSSNFGLVRQPSLVGKVVPD